MKRHLKEKINHMTGELICCEFGISSILTSGGERSEFSFNHVEADTMLISICAKLRESDFNDAVVIDSEDIDVYVQAAYSSNQLPGVLLLKQKFIERSSCILF